MTRPRTIPLIVTALCVLLTGTPAAHPQAAPTSIDALMGAALHQQEVEGNLGAAAATYRKVLADSRATPALRARALVQLGQISEALQRSDARAYYERVVREFPGETASVAAARARLAALGSAPAAASRPGNGAAESPARKLLTRYAPFWGVSPDGRYLTFGHLNNIFLRDTRDGEERQVTRGGVIMGTNKDPQHPTDARFAKDGQRLAYGWKQPGGYQLRVIDTDGSDERTVTSNPEHDWLGPIDWSDDGTRVLAKINSRGNGGQIAWVALDGGAVQVLKTVPWAALGRVSLSPDGRYIAFDQRNAEAPSVRTIHVLTADGSHESALTDGTSRDDVVGWLPDGSGLAFVTHRSGSPELWMQPWKNGQKTGAARLLKRNLGAIDPLGFTNAGALIYSQIVSTGDAYVASIDWDAGRVVEPRKISANIIADGGTAWSPDGTQVAYVAHRGTEVRRKFVAVHAVKDGTTREVQPSEEMVIQTTGGHKWSPDGATYLVNGSTAPQSSTTFAMDLRNGKLRPLVRFTNAYAQTPQWINGGKSLFSLVRDQRKPAAEVFVFDIASGEKRPLRHGFESMRVGGFLASPDEQSVAFVVASDTPPATLRVMPLAGGTPRALVEAPGYSLWPIAWTPDSQHLVYSRTDRSRNEAGQARAPFEPFAMTHWVVSLQTGEAREMRFPHPGPHGVDISPDGRRVAYSVTANEIEVWALERVSAPAPSSRQR